MRGNTVVTMDFDSMGRRTFYRETENDVLVSHSRFFYDGYLMIQQLGPDSPYVLQKEFIWDPTESVATKPLVFRQNGLDTTYLTHDGNKNVADIIRAAPYNDSVGHYEYAPFGAVTSAVGSRAMDNPFRFSSEYADDTLGLDYYNYRHYEPVTGRWCSRDFIDESGALSLYAYSGNSISIDYLGLVNPSSFLDGVTDPDVAKKLIEEKFPNDPKRCLKEFRIWNKAHGGRQSSLMRKLKSTKTNKWKMVKSGAGKLGRSAVRCGCVMFMTIEVVLIPMSAQAEPVMINGRPVFTQEELTKILEGVPSKEQCEKPTEYSETIEEVSFKDDGIWLSNDYIKKLWEAL